MGIQGLLQKGEKNCSNLEKGADAILIFPRFMWRSREVKMITQADKKEIINSRSLSFTNIMNDIRMDCALKAPDGSYTVLFFSMAIFYVLGSVLASPLLALGLACKKIALVKDPKAHTYHKLLASEML